jgi:predicted enzyme related to lactoylglutathione lyase
MNKIILQKPMSIVFLVRELRKAAAWYGKLLNITPYRNDLNFIGFHLNGIDLCFHRIDIKAGTPSGSQIAYWHVENLNETITTFVESGASIHREPIGVVEGGRVAQIKDPFGNILGLKEN